jgi:LacI family transcriptional regulator
MEDAYAETQTLLDLTNPPTAIWTVNDLLAIGVLRAINERGLRVPEDVALAGFDDIEFAQQLYPPLTTVRMPAYELGLRAAEFLFERLDDPKREPMTEVMPVQLVIRGSTVPRQAVNTPAEHNGQRSHVGSLV